MLRQWLRDTWCHVMPIAIALHNQQSNVGAQFNCLDLRNAMLPLMTPLASCNAIALTNGVIWHMTKESCCTLLQSSLPEECNGVTDDAWASCNADTKAIT